MASAQARNGVVEGLGKISKVPPAVVNNRESPSMRERCPNDASIRGSSPLERADGASGEVVTRVNIDILSEV